MTRARFRRVRRVSKTMIGWLGAYHVDFWCSVVVVVVVVVPGPLSVLHRRRRGLFAYQQNCYVYNIKPAGHGDDSSAQVTKIHGGTGTRSTMVTLGVLEGCPSAGMHSLFALVHAGIAGWFCGHGLIMTFIEHPGDYYLFNNMPLAIGSDIRNHATLTQYERDALASCYATPLILLPAMYIYIRCMGLPHQHVAVFELAVCALLAKDMFWFSHDNVRGSGSSRSLLSLTFLYLTAINAISTLCKPSPPPVCQLWTS